jgi:hypothetical protein
MNSLRTTLLVLILGSAAAIGWLCSPARSNVDRGVLNKDGERAVIHPPTNHASGRHVFPGRQRTNPDPTPDDLGAECSSLVDLNRQGSDWAVIGSAIRATTELLVESPEPSWIEPARSDHPLRINRRFRC